MVARRTPSLRTRLRVYAGPITLGLVWLSAVGAAGAIAWKQQHSGTTTALAVTRTHLLHAPASGWIVEVDAAPGQQVEAGAVLARVDVPGMAQELAAAEAAVRAAEEGLAIEGADRDRRFAKEIESARRAVLAAQVSLTEERGLLAEAEAELARLSSPGADVAAGLVAQQRALVATRSGALATREKQVAGLEDAFEAARARAHLSYTGEAELAAAVARRDALQARLNANELRATTGGVVGPQVPTPGEWTAAGTALITVTEPVSNEVVAYVAVPYARTLTVGAAVQLMPEGQSAVSGTIAGIGPAVEPVPEALHPMSPTWSMPVHIRTDAQLAPGETVGVDL